MKVAIVNLGQTVTGNRREPFAAGDAMVVDGERMASVCSASSNAIAAADVVIDADDMTAIPGLIGSHVHITFGDYTPRQRTVGYLESYVHGGTTTAISASEVHVPGRPRDVEGVKAPAVAAQRCFADWQPVHLPRRRKKGFLPGRVWNYVHDASVTLICRGAFCGMRPGIPPNDGDRRRQSRKRRECDTIDFAAGRMGDATSASLI